MKRIAKIAALLMAVVLIVSTGESVTAMAASGPKLSKTSRNIYVGGSTVATNVYAKGTYTLSVKNRPAKYTIEWSSSDESIAKVAPYKGTSKYKGTVTAVAPGKATITATVIDKTTMPYSQKKLTCKVTVKQNCAAVDIVPAKVEDIKVGDSVTLKGIMYDSGANELFKGETTTDIIKWMSSNTAVATVSSSGVVKAVGAGKATITCYTIQASTGTYSKFKYATAKDTIELDVKEAGKQAMTGVKQLSLNSFKITFASDFSKIVTKDNLKVTRSNTAADVSKIEFDTTGTSATVTMSAALVQTLTYRVELTGTDAVRGTQFEFKASSGKPAKMEFYTAIPGNRVIAGETSTIYYRFLDADGIDVTPLDKTGAEYTRMVSLINAKAADNATFSSVYNTNVWIYNPGDSVVVIATYNDYAGTSITAAGTIVAVSEASTITGVETLVTNSEKQASVLDWSKPQTSLSKSDVKGYKLVARAKKADGTYVYSDDPGTKLAVGFAPNYEQKSMFLYTNGTIYPFALGSDQVLVTYDGTVVGVSSVSVGPERVPIRMAVMVDGEEKTVVELSDVFGITNPEIKAVLYDNYGEVYPLTSTFGVTATPVDPKSSAIFTVSKINSDGSISIDPVIWGIGTASGNMQTVLVKVDDGKINLSSAFNAIIYKPNESITTTYKAIATGETDAVINASFDPVNGKTVNVKLVGYKGNVRYEEVSLYDAASVPVGQYYAIMRKGSETVPVTLVGGAVELPVAKVSAGNTISKMAPGEYVITCYRKTAGLTDVPVASTKVVVTDSQSGARYTKLKNTTSISLTATSSVSEQLLAFEQCFKVTVDGETASAISIDAITTTGGMYVKTVTVQATKVINSVTYTISYNVDIYNAISVAH